MGVLTVWEMPEKMACAILTIVQVSIHYIWSYPMIIDEYVVLPLVDGVWSNYSPWSECSVTCGSGIRSRSRTCTPPRYGGKDCEGSTTEMEVCLKSDCIGKKKVTI